MIARVFTPTRAERAVLWASTAVRLLLAGVFLTAGGLKVIDPASSVAAVRAYQLLPAPLETLVGWGLPFAEIALGLLLAIGVFTRALAVVSAVVLGIFVAAVVSASVRGLSIDCGCFGGGGTVSADETNYLQRLVEDVGLLACGLWLSWRPTARLSLDRAMFRPATT